MLTSNSKSLGNHVVSPKSTLEQSYARNAAYQPSCWQLCECVASLLDDTGD